MIIAKCGTNKLCKLKSDVMQQRDVVLSQVTQQLKQVFFSLLPTVTQAFIEGKLCTFFI